MDINQKINFLTNELSDLKQKSKDGSGISEDTRKAIIHDVSNLQDDKSNKRIIMTVTLFAAIVSLASYIGFLSIKQSISETLVDSTLKQELTALVAQERLNLKNEVASIKNDLIMADNANRVLKERYSLLTTEMDKKQEELTNLARIMTRLAAKNIHFEKLIDDTLDLKLIDSIKFNFTKALGISEFSVIKILTLYVDSFNPTDITVDNLSNSIINLQERYGLTQDGELGPCTAITVGALYKLNFPLEADKSMRESIFIKMPWLVKAFQACSQNDGSNVERYLSYPDLPLHKELNNFVDALNIDKGILKQSLKSKVVTISGYKALESIGYTDLDFAVDEDTK